MSDDQERGSQSRLGPPLERGIPAVPPRWRLPLLLLVLGGCVTIFLVSIVYALTR